WRSHAVGSDSGRAHHAVQHRAAHRADRFHGGGSGAASSRSRCWVLGVRADPSDPTDPTDPTRTPNTEHPIPNPERLLQRVLYWTGGHPYLTQRLSQAVAEQLASNPKSKTQNPKLAVDRLCGELFLSHSAQERDDNLQF